MRNVWLIGAGEMSQYYIRVLDHLGAAATVIGRGERSAIQFKKVTGRDVEIGGLERFLSKDPKACSHAIVSVDVRSLFETTKQLLNYDIKNILIEKPGALLASEFEELVELSNYKEASIYIAYNRRFFASVVRAKEMIARDGGVTSFNFEFTEWSHVISPLKKGEGEKEKWFLGNSTHVVDLAFYLGGSPKDLSSYTSGGLDWHPSASIFCGAGISNLGALFSYTANWESAGRWGVEILTKDHKLILRPLEKLRIQKRGSITANFVEDINYSLDDKFKPGLYIQTEKFLKNKFREMCSIREQAEAVKTYNRMANYK